MAGRKANVVSIAALSKSIERAVAIAAKRAEVKTEADSLVPDGNLRRYPARVRGPQRRRSVCERGHCQH